MDFSAFDGIFELTDQLKDFINLIKEAFSLLPSIFATYWSGILLVLIFVGLMAIIIRLIS